MAVREFNGVTTTGDYIDFDDGDVGAINNGSIGLTMLILMKPMELAAHVDPYFAVTKTAGGILSLAAMYYDGGGTDLEWGSEDPDGDSVAEINMSASEWQILGMTKAAGTTNPRMHRKVLGSGSWTHANAATAVASSSGAAAETIHLSRFSSLNAERAWMRVAVAAIWNSVLSDANFETIEAAASTAAIMALSPDWVVDLNQTSVTQAVCDLKDYTNVGGDQTARVGTTVVTSDDPAWQFLWPVKETDDFNRANESPLSGGGNWVNPGDPSSTALNLVSNQVQPGNNALDACHYWGARTWGDNQFSRCAITVGGFSGGAGPGPCVRRSHLSQSYYRLAIGDNAGTATCELTRFNSGSVTGMDTWTTPYADGDVYELRVDGQGAATHLYGFKNGLPIGDTLDDGSFGSGQLNSGFPGLAYSSETFGIFYDNWEGGDQLEDEETGTPPIPLSYMTWGGQ